MSNSSVETVVNYLIARVDNLKAAKHSLEVQVATLTQECESLRAENDALKRKQQQDQDVSPFQTPSKTVPRHATGGPASGKEWESAEEDDDDKNKAVLKRMAEAARQVSEGLLKPASERLDVSENGRSFSTSLQSGKVEQVRRLLSRDPRLMQMRILFTNELFGFTPLHVAASSGHVEVCKALLEQGADLEATDLVGRTPLHVAAGKLHQPVVELLLEAMGDSAIGERAPQDAGGITPAGYSALKTKDRELKAKLMSSLHRMGDACISPISHHKTRPKTRNRKTGLASTIVYERHAAMLEEEEGALLPSQGPPDVFYGCCSIPGFRVAMEDAVTLATRIGPNEQVSLFAVFDGHGGRGVAEYCSENICRIFEGLPEVQCGAVLADPNALTRALSLTCVQVDREMQQLPHFKVREVTIPGYRDEESRVEYKTSDNSGSTGILVAITPTVVALANLGDSRGLVLQGGQVVLSTRDQRVPAEADLERDPAALDWWTEEKQRVEQAGGFVTPEGRIHYREDAKDTHLAMTRAFGDFVFKHPNPVILAEPDVYWVWRDSSEEQLVILASDGIWDVISSQACGEKAIALLERFASETSWQSSTSRVEALDKVCEEIAVDSMVSNDNLSVVAIRLPPTMTMADAHRGLASSMGQEESGEIEELGSFSQDVGSVQRDLTQALEREQDSSPNVVDINQAVSFV